MPDVNTTFGGYTVETTAGTAWPAWTSATTDYSGSVTYATRDLVWPAWANDTATNTTTYAHTFGTAAEAWGGWNLLRIRYVVPPQPSEYVSPFCTPAQQAEQQRRDRLQRTKLRLVQDRDRRKALPAERKALSLLEQVLSPERWQEYRRHGSVRVRGSAGGLYQVGHGYTDKVYALDPDTAQPTRKLCVHAGYGYPEGDRVAALVLALAVDEQHVLKTANLHPMDDVERRRVAARRERRTPQLQPTRRTA